MAHLRCHLTDVTDKIKAERELRLRTRELTQVNEQLRQINRELEELKDRYRDLYQNAPAMYYSLDADGRLIDCNETLLQTLGYPREDLADRPFTTILAEPAGRASPRSSPSSAAGLDGDGEPVEQGERRSDRCLGVGHGHPDP